jgi:hypothetical protein
MLHHGANAGSVISLGGIQEYPAILSFCRFPLINVSLWAVLLFKAKKKNACFSGAFKHNADLYT